MKFVFFLRKVIYQPVYVLLICLCLVLVDLAYDSTVMALLKLSKKKKELVQNIDKLQEENLVLSDDIKRAYDLQYLEMQAIDRLGLLRSQDLLIVFSD